MQVSTIQNHQLANSTKGIQAKKISHSIGGTKDLTTDSFSREKTNDVSFKGAEGAVKGGLIGMVVGSLAAVAAVVVTGGAAAPFAAVYFGGVAAGTATGAVIGSVIDD